MKELLYDPWLVGVMTQIIGGVIAGLVVHFVTNRSKPVYQTPDFSTQSRRYKLNWRYIVFYVVIISGIVGITFIQDPQKYDMYQITTFLLLVAWWSMVALNIFVLMDGGKLRRYYANPILYFVGILIPLVGHSKTVTYVLFTLITKAGCIFLTYGISNRLDSVATPQHASGRGILAC